MLICTTLVLVTASVAVVLEALASPPVSLDELHPTATIRTKPVKAAILCMVVWYRRVLTDVQPLLRRAGPRMALPFEVASARGVQVEHSVDERRHALIAPRPVVLQAGRYDHAADPKGEFMAAVAAEPGYGLLGADVSGSPEADWPPPTPILDYAGYYMHDGGHGTSAEDRSVFLDFLQRHLHGQ
jgi:hypothetical protein